ADGKSKPWSYVEKAHYNCASWAGGPFTRPYSYYEPFIDNDDNIFVRGGKYFDPLYITAISCVENGGDVQFLFTKNGTPVTSFGTGGKIINSTKLLKTSTLSLGDKVLSFSMGNTSNSYVIYKNLRNGSPNGTFGNGGKTLFYQSLIKLAQPINPYHSCFLSDSSFLIGFLHNDSIFFSKHFIRKDEFVSFSLLSKNVGLVFDTFRLSPAASPGIKSFRWNIPGAIYINGTDSNSSHPEFVFTSSGYKSVNVFGVDENGNILDSYQQTNFITVFHLDFLSSINFGAIGTPIQLNSLVSPFPASYKWEIEGNPVFYSGYNLHVQNPYFYFAKTGSFSIKLTIKTASGDSFTISKPDYIRMYSLTFTQDKSTSTLTNPIFNVSATSNPLANRYLWMAKPASGQAENSVSIVGSNLSNATITATDTGWYQVQVTGYFGVSDSVIILKNRAIYISVEPITNKPIADFFVNKRSGNTNEIFFFNDSSRYFPTEWEWTITPNNAWFEDSDNRSKNPFVAFFENGSYTIKLKVGNAFGADSIVKYDYIQIGPVGLAEPNRKKELLIYPNPVKEQLFVKYFGKEAPILKIIDMSGKVVYESLYAASDSNAMEINTTELPSGFYFISIQTNESIINKTFVLSR
ncbi:MAG: T9SS type A sorting domain-containing protein, partial [Bacteroidia bacterium]|nr:T9SS type A sorting domain-containing protein [Bacteroidia bacterium]